MLLLSTRLDCDCRCFTESIWNLSSWVCHIFFSDLGQALALLSGVTSIVFHYACSRTPSSVRATSVTLGWQLRNMWKNILFRTTGKFRCGKSCPIKVQMLKSCRDERGPKYRYGKKIIPGFLRANTLHVVENVPELPTVGGWQITTEMYHCASFDFHREVD